MKVEKVGPNIRIELTRRNLWTLLTRLDAGDPRPCLSQYRPDGDPDGRYYATDVIAVEDAEHYSDREPGPMDDETEAALTQVRQPTTEGDRG